MEVLPTSGPLHLVFLLPGVSFLGSFSCFKFQYKHQPCR
jgi:hypothetical protein